MRGFLYFNSNFLRMRELLRRLFHGVLPGQSAIKNDRSLRQALERTGAEQALRGDVAIFDIREESRPDPGCLRFADWLCQLRRIRPVKAALPSETYC